MKDTSSLSRLTALAIAVALAIAGFAAIPPGLAGAEGSNVPLPAEPERYGLEYRRRERLSDLPPIFGAWRELPEEDNGDGTPRSEDGSGEDTRLTEYPAAEGTSSEERSDPTDGTVAAVRIYIVQSGDNLTYIAEAQYGIADDRAAYLQALVIWSANREVVGPDPDFILTGQALDLPVDGQLPAQPEGGDTPPPITEAGEAAPTGGFGSESATGLSEADGDAAGVVAVGSGPPEEVVRDPVENVINTVMPPEPPVDGIGEAQPSSDEISFAVLDLPQTVLLTLALVIAIALAIAVWAAVAKRWAAAAARAGPGTTRIANRDTQYERTAPAAPTTVSAPVQAMPGENSQVSASSTGAGGHGAAPLVLLADGDLSAASFMARELAAQGLAVVALHGGGEALLHFEEIRPDVVVVDQSMPDMTSVTAMQTLCQSTTVPVILLLDVDSPAGKFRGRDLGADDCLTKPVNTAELGACIRAVLRRTNGGPKPDEFQPVIQVKDLEIDLFHRMVRRNGHLFELTPTEWQLLRYLALNAGRVLAKEEILVSIWGHEYRDADHYLRIWIPRLRRRLLNTQAADAIKTIHGMGYVLDI